jgi:hypothetical protein
VPAASRTVGDAVGVGLEPFAAGVCTLGVGDAVVGAGGAVVGTTFAGAVAPITPLPAVM